MNAEDRLKAFEELVVMVPEDEHLRLVFADFLKEQEDYEYERLVRTLPKLAFVNAKPKPKPAHTEGEPAHEWISKETLYTILTMHHRREEETLRAWLIRHDASAALIRKWTSAMLKKSPITTKVSEFDFNRELIRHRFNALPMFKPPLAILHGPITEEKCPPPQSEPTPTKEKESNSSNSSEDAPS